MSNTQINFVTADGKFEVYTTSNKIITTLRLDPIDPDEEFYFFHSDLYDITRLVNDLKVCSFSKPIIKDIDSYKLKENIMNTYTLEDIVKAVLLVLQEKKKEDNKRYETINKSLMRLEVEAAERRAKEVVNYVGRYGRVTVKPKENTNVDY